MPSVYDQIGDVSVVGTFIGLGVIWLFLDYSREKAEKAIQERAKHAKLQPQWTIGFPPVTTRRATQEAQLHQQQEQQRLAAERAQQHAEWLKKIQLSEYLQTMHPREFEELVCRLFERMGYQVTRTRYTGDNGVDAYLRREEHLSVLQCKRVKKAVGEPILRDLFGTMHAARASSAFVVTTGTVSRQARTWIKGKPISILELSALQELLRHHFSEGDVGSLL